MLNRIKESKYLKKLGQITWNVIVKYNQHNCPIMAAGMSFFGLMSLIPMVIIGVSTLGYIIGSSESAQQFMATILSNNFPKSADEILNQIYIIITSPERNVINGLSLVGLIWSGMRFFNILQSVLNSIWVGAKQRWFLLGNATAFLIFMIAGLLFWVSFAFNWFLIGLKRLNLGGIGDISEFWLIVKFIVQFSTLIIMTFFSYLFIPNTKVSPKAALVGSLFATTFLELYRWGFGAIITNFVNYGKVYGPLAGIVIFISWLYMSMSILLVGAELGSQCQQMFFSSNSKPTKKQSVNQ